MILDKKPLLRGHFHQAAFFIAIGACATLLFKNKHMIHLPSVVIYSLSLITLLGVSALYHRINWKPTARMVMRRLDHAAIYFLIAGTITPIALYALSEESARHLLIWAWIVAGVGMLLSITFTKKPKWLNALLCALAGVVILPYVSEIGSRLGGINIVLFLIGGLAYALGGLAYAVKRPNFCPKVFGYHEVFHFMVIVGASSHFIVIHSMV